MWQTPTLFTENLQLRPIKESDASNLYCCARMKAEKPFQPWDTYQDVEEVIAQIRGTYFQNYRTQTPYPWVITLKEDTEVALGLIEAEPIEGDTWTMTFKYLLCDSYHGHGILPEASRTVLCYFFQTKPSAKLVADCLVHDHVQISFLEALGFENLGVCSRKAHNNGQSYDVLEFKLTSTQWFENDDISHIAVS